MKKKLKKMVNHNILKQYWRWGKEEVPFLYDTNDFVKYTLFEANRFT